MCSTGQTETSELLEGVELLEIFYSQRAEVCYRDRIEVANIAYLGM